MTVEIIPLEDHLLPAAGELLAAAHRRGRRELPELPAAFEDPQTAAEAVARTRARPGARGLAAVEDGHMRAYLAGETLLDAQIWGRSAWVRLPGSALAEGAGPHLVGRLYAALGASWVRWGCFRHLVYVPRTEARLTRAWFELGFGVEAIEAVLDFEDIPAPGGPPPGVEIRRAGPDDRETLRGLSDLIWREQVQAPDWGIQFPEEVAGNREGWAETLDEPGAQIWLAFVGGQPAGSLGFFHQPAEPDNLLVPPDCCDITLAGTRPEFRGRGIMRALFQRGAAEMAAAGYRFCQTYWRSANLSAAQTWPRLGFRPAAYRLSRRVDPRIAWANGEAADG